MARGLNALSMLKANQTQTPNGTSLNPSAMALGSGIGGDVLQDQVRDQLKQQRKTPGPASFGSLLSLASGVFGIGTMNGG